MISSPFQKSFEWLTEDCDLNKSIKSQYVVELMSKKNSKIMTTATDEQARHTRLFLLELSIVGEN